MHIPDGYLSPQTCAVLGAAAAVALGQASKNVRREYSGRELPLLSIGAAFSFVLMMFNIPIPDGTTAHAVGGTLLAIVLGPWAASLTMTVALVVQAVFFGDGGILALGANVFNMAVILPFAGYWLYRLLSRKLSTGLAAFISGYLAILAAALATAVVLGLQPVFFRSADGLPLYSPYSLRQAVAAMAFAHLLIAGPAEGIITAGALAYLRAHDNLAQLFPRLARESAGAAELAAAVGTERSAEPSRGAKWPNWWPLAAVIAVLLLLAPLGLLPEGSAWGEWSAEEIGQQLGFIPAGLERLGSLWRGILPDYAFPANEPNGAVAVLGYIVSGLVGIGLIGLVFWLVAMAFHATRGRSQRPRPTRGA